MVAIVQTIYGSIELIVSPNGHHYVLARLKLVWLNRGNRELRFACCFRESASFRCRIRQVKYVLSDTLIEIFETWNHPLDTVPDAAVVSNKLLPWNRGPVHEGCPG